MKYIILAIAVLSLFACDPRHDEYLTGTIAINAQVINPKTTIQLGDSVAFYFEVPDTVQLNGLNIVVSNSNNDGATIGLTPYKIIATNTGGSTNNPSKRTCVVYANPGSLSVNETLYFQNQNGKLTAKFYMIPLAKGVYYMLQTQEGYIDLNNQTLKARFSFNFGNINRNHQMLIDSAGTLYNFSLYLQGLKDRGLEVYGFKVE